VVLALALISAGLARQNYGTVGIGVVVIKAKLFRANQFSKQFIGSIAITVR
jgi:hypothetical protein